MSDLSSTSPTRGRVRRLRSLAPARHREIMDLRERMTELEKEVQESRRLHRRLAELTDVVQELLVPLAQQDEKKVQAYLDRYSAAL